MQTYYTLGDIKAIALLAKAGELTSEELSDPNVGRIAANKILALAEEIKLDYNKMINDPSAKESIIDMAIICTLQELHKADTISARAELVVRMTKIKLNYNLDNLDITLDKQNNIIIKTDWF